MATSVILPCMGLTTVEGTVIKWLKREGDSVTKDEPLVEVETDKAVTQVEAPESGILLRIVQREGSVVPVTHTLCYIGRQGEELTTQAELTQAVAAPQSQNAENAEPASMAARSPTPEPSSLSTTMAVPSGTSVPPSAVSRTIARHMAESSQTVACVTISTEVDMTETVRLREELSRQRATPDGPRISCTHIAVKAAALALRQQPMMNGRLLDDRIQLLEEINVGIAVGSPDGVVVPVIRRADHKTLASITREADRLLECARTGTLPAEDVSGGSFTVTDLGEYEVDAFTPIVSLPQVGTLGLGRIVERPVVFEGAITARAMMFLSLSFDHRVIDGGPAASFLRQVKQCLENPCTLLL